MIDSLVRMIFGDPKVEATELKSAFCSSDNLSTKVQRVFEDAIRYIKSIFETPSSSKAVPPKGQVVESDKPELTFLEASAFESAAVRSTKILETDSEEEGFTEITLNSRQAFNNTEPNHKASLRKFEKKGKLGQSAVVSFLETLQKKNNALFEYDTSCIFGQKQTASFSLKPNPNKRYLFIPIILQGSFDPFGCGWCDHIVCMVYDNQESKLYYYDPQGKDVKNETRKIKGQSITPLELLKNHLNIPTFSYVSNLNKQQKDHISCGLFVDRFMERMLREPFEKVTADLNVDLVKERVRQLKLLDVNDLSKSKKVF